MEKVFRQELYINGSRVYIYVTKRRIEELSETVYVDDDGYFIYVSSSEMVPKGFKLVKLPSEQSLLSFFPLSLLYGKDAMKAMDIISSYAKIIRSRGTKVLCFHDGCKKPARFYAIAPGGLDGGCWFACSEEHFNEKTSKGIAINHQDYLSFDGLSGE
jgi:hypothetical protein